MDSLMNDFIEQAQRLISDASALPRTPSIHLSESASRSYSSPIKESPASKHGFSNDQHLQETATLSTPLSSDSRRSRKTDAQLSSIAQATDQVDDAILPPELKKKAELFAKILRDMQPKFIDLLELLFKMLALDDLVGGGTSNSSESSSFHQLRPNQAVKLELYHCAPFAVAVLTRCEQLLKSLGPQICEQLSKQPSIKKWAPNLAFSLTNRAAANGREVYGELFPKNQVSHREETDSKHHFKTQDQKELFHNRETVRDNFLTILNQVITSKNQFTSYYPAEDPSRNATFHACVRSILPENISWFARLFVQYLINLSKDDREFDKGVKQYAKHHHKEAGGAERLDKLSKRFTNMVPDRVADVPNSVPVIGVGGSTFARSTQSNSNQQYGGAGGQYRGGGASNQQQRITTSKYNGNQNNEWWDLLFPRPAERFFPLFVFVVDSHSLNMNIQAACQSKLDSLTFDSHDQSLSEKIAACNVLAKFLGFLAHYPRFATSNTALQHRASSQAFDEMFQETVQEAKRAGPVGLQLGDILVRAGQSGKLPMVVPWVIRYLKAGPLYDCGAQEAGYIRITIAMLRCIWRDLRVIRRSVNQGTGFSFVRMLADLDQFLEEWDAKVLRKDTSEEYREWDVIQVFSDVLIGYGPDRWNKEELTQFDAVPLDRPVTTCAALERLRQLLVFSTTMSAGGAIAGRAKLRRIASSVTSADGSTENLERAATEQSGNLLVPQNPTTAQPQDPCMQAIAHSCLQQQEEVTRLKDFAVLTAPGVVMAQMEQYIAGNPTIGGAEKISNVNELNEAEFLATESVTVRSFQLTKRFVENLVELTLGHKRIEYRRSVLVIILEIVDAAVEKALRRRLRDIFQAQRTRILNAKQKYQERQAKSNASNRS